MTIVDSIMQCAGSDKLTEGAWKTLVIRTKDVLNGDLEYVLKKAEREFKERTGYTKLPSRWRSAKSVLMKARGVGVALVSGDSVIGKSAVEKACKEALPTRYKAPMDIAAKGVAIIRQALSQETSETVRVAMIASIKQELDKLC